MSQAENKNCLQLIQKAYLSDSVEKFAKDGKSSSIQHNILKHRDCMSSVVKKVKICLPKAIDVCKNSSIQALEVIRSNMESLEDLILRVPDLYVIYYVRDPRAIVNSVLSTDLTTSIGPTDFFSEAEIICHKMEEDLKHYEILKSKFPGVFLLTKYEDLVTDPVSFGDKVYQHIGLNKATQRWVRFSQTALHSDSSTGTFGVKRKDGTKSIEKWREGLSVDTVIKVNALCKHVLEKLDYEIRAI